LVAPIATTEEVRRLATHPMGVVLHDAIGPDGERYRMATVAIEHAGVIRGYSQMGVRIKDRDAPLRQLAISLALASAISLGLAWLGIHLWLQQWRTPLRTFESTARQITATGVARHRFVAPPDSPELRTVANAFNELLDQLDAAQSS